MNRRRQIIMPSDVFPPHCGGAGWSAHALALALQQHGEQVTAVVPRPNQHIMFYPHSVLNIDTIDVAQPHVSLPLLQTYLRQQLLIPRLRTAIQRAIIDPAHTIIHAQHLLAAQAAMPLRRLGAKVIVTVRDHWPWDYRATGMQMHGDQRTLAGMQHTMKMRNAPLAQRILAPAYVRQMRQRADLLAQADMVIGVSQYIRECIAQHIPNATVVAIPNMVDCVSIATTITQPLTVANVPEHFSLFVGKLARNKGAELLPELILRIRPPAIVVAGDGPLNAAVAAAAQAAAIPCLLLDWVDHDDVLRLMARCDALWFPSSWDEPLSRVLLEALACGAPIVAMPTGGTPEIIIDGTSGILAADIASFVTAAQRLHDDARWRQRIQAGARLRAQQFYDSNVVIRQFLALYDRIGGAS
ncbi:MAG: glycosyltransferase [Chloroflexales bacterium]|nr:glycosyltransferase [Chloroflexales bacterium]